MGLCKCPKRRVTNQFCFEHRVNVCEHCMVQKHPNVSLKTFKKSAKTKSDKKQRRSSRLDQDRQMTKLNMTSKILFFTVCGSKLSSMASRQ